jgi:hypothetical protein
MTTDAAEVLPGLLTEPGAQPLPADFAWELLKGAMRLRIAKGEALLLLLLCRWE